MWAYSELTAGSWGVGGKVLFVQLSRWNCYLDLYWIAEHFLSLTLFFSVLPRCPWVGCALSSVPWD